MARRPRKEGDVNASSRPRRSSPPVGTRRGTLAAFATRPLAAVALLLAAVAGLTPAPALAQDATAPSRGITTIGYGEASAPAESATLQMLITREDYGPPRPPRPSATPGAEERALVTPIVDALVDAGLPEDQIGILISPVVGEYYGPGGLGITRLDITVDEPTQERILELINAAVPVAAQQAVLIGQVGVGYDVADCSALERQAREAAFDNARERAEIQADLLGVALGDPVASNDLPPSEATATVYFDRLLSAETGCSPPAPTISQGVAVNLPPFDPSGEAEVEVFAQVAVTFAIGEGAA